VTPVRRVAPVVVLLASIAACSSDDSNVASTTAAPVESTSTTLEPIEDNLGLTWRTIASSDAEADVLRATAQRIGDANEAFDVDYESVGPDGYLETLTQEITDGDGPDVFWVSGTDLATAASSGLLLNIAPVAGTVDLDAFPVGPSTDLQTDPADGVARPGEFLWGLPSELDTRVLYVNRTLLAAAGATDPYGLASAGQWTTEAFAGIAETVTESADGNVGFAMNAAWESYGAWMVAAGGGVLTADRTACAIDTAESIAGLTSIFDVYDAGHALPYGSDALGTWLSGTVAMVLAGRDFTPIARDNAGFDWDVIGLPSAGGPSTRSLQLWGAYVVNAKTAYPDEAWALLQSLVAADAQRARAEVGNTIPSRITDGTATAVSDLVPPASSAVFVSAVSADPVPEGPIWTGSWVDYDSGVSAAMVDVLTGVRGIEDIRTSLCAEVSIAFD
jgi:multiple sugar transport system substrate-binding protein